VVEPGRDVLPMSLPPRPSEPRIVDDRLLCMIGLVVKSCDFMSGVFCRLGRVGGLVWDSGKLFVP
jgi:hypothetical protein